VSEREDWFADTEGNLRLAGGEEPGASLKPPTDEFGRDDPAAIERERRRREREARRQKRGKRRASTDGGKPEAAANPSSGRSSNPKRVAPKRTALASAERPRTTPKPAEPRPARRRRFRRGGERPPRAGNYRRRRIVALALTLVGLLLAWFLIALFQPFRSSQTGASSRSASASRERRTTSRPGATCSQPT
jgi:hypothetical protein